MTITHTRLPDGRWLVTGLVECLWHGGPFEGPCRECAQLESGIADAPTIPTRPTTMEATR